SQYLPPGETAQADSGLEPARTAWTGRPEAASHKRRWASQPADSTKLPSGGKAHANTSPWWPLTPGPPACKRNFGTTSLPVDVHEVLVRVSMRGTEWHPARATLKHSSRFFSRGRKCVGTRLSAAGGVRRCPRRRRPRRPCP